MHASFSTPLPLPSIYPLPHHLMHEQCHSLPLIQPHSPGPLTTPGQTAESADLREGKGSGGLMFTLSPKQDLILLAMKHNHPESSWEQISELILLNYNCVIPSDICCQRYELFLKKVLLKQHLHNYANLRTLALQNGPPGQSKIPENFIFAYRECKEKTGDTPEVVSLKCLENYEKKLVCRLFGFERLDRTRTIAKPKPYNGCKQDHYKGNQQSYKARQDHWKAIEDYEFKNELYRIIKQHTSGVLTETIIQQKIEQLMLEIVETVNERIVQFEKNSQETIANGLELIRLMRKYSLLERRRRVFEICYHGKGVHQGNYVEIKNIFKHIQLTFSQQGKCVSEGKSCQQYLEILPELDIRKYLQEHCDLEVKQEPQEEQEEQQQEQQEEQLARLQQKQLELTEQQPPQTNQQLQNNQQQPDSSKQPIYPIQPKQVKSPVMAQPIQEATKIAEKQIISNFQITIVNANSLFVSTPNQPDAQVKVEVKQEEQEKIKLQEEPEPPTVTPKGTARGRGGKTKKPSKTYGKVWLIIND